MTHHGPRVQQLTIRPLHTQHAISITDQAAGNAPDTPTYSEAS
jgi:hypothetical protein